MKAVAGTSVEVGIAALKLLLDDLLEVRQHALSPGPGVGGAVPDALAAGDLGIAVEEGLLRAEPPPRMLGGAHRVSATAAGPRTPPRASSRPAAVPPAPR